MLLETAALITYLVLFAAFTAAIGRFLRVHGGVFLRHTFAANPDVARAVQNLLDLGFYLLCVSLLLWNIGTPPTPVHVSGASFTKFDLSDAAQSVSIRLGISILVVAGFHSLNILVLSILNRKSNDRPVEPPAA